MNGSVTGSVGETPDAILDQEDVPYPCKGCGEILEEGKAFELAGNRWHINCFRCNTCETLLDSDANLLLLSDGSLICNNCTYSCNACGNKIEDLAILTGDQAFCADCFRCRGCRRKIENLRYARTSAGIFCMQCHETIMNKRKKKSRAAAAAQPKPGSGVQSPMLLDKSLPSLPPNATPPVSLSDRDPSPLETAVDIPPERSPRPRPANPPPSSSDRNLKRERSPLTPDKYKKENVRHRSRDASIERHSSDSQHGDGLLGSAGSGGSSSSFHIPLVLDTGNGAELPRRAASHRSDDADMLDYESKSRRSSIGAYYAGVPVPHAPHAPPPAQPIPPRDASLLPSAEVSPRMQYSEPPHPMTSAQTDATRRPKPTALLSVDPQSDTTRRGLPGSTGAEDLRLQHATARPAPENGNIQSSHGDKFTLQEVPKGKKSGGSTRSYKSESPPPSEGRVAMNVDTPPSSGSKNSSLNRDHPASNAHVQMGASQALRPHPDTTPRTSSDSKRTDELPSEAVHGPAASRLHQLPSRPDRRDSLRGANSRQNSRSKEAPSRLVTQPSPGSTPGHEFSPSPSAGATPDDSNSAFSSIIDAPRGPSPEAEAVPEHSFDAAESHRRHPERQGSSGVGMANGLTSSPRQISESLTQSPRQVSGASPRDVTRLGDARMSPGLPRHTGSGDLNLDEDMARILGDADESSASLLRRVSNAVRHGRSFSDMEMRSRASAKWSRSPPLNGSIGSPPTREISSPTTGSSEAREENAILKHELRRSAQRIVELEARVSGNSDMKSLDTKLREKRSTMAFLDTQKELIVRELEVLTEHVADSKRTQQPLNLDVLRSKVVRDFAAALQRLKDSYGPEIEELVQRKNQLVEETANLSRLRDQAIQEMEQLNLKNAQLADLNNELTHQIQERYRANREVGALDSPRYQINGLGIYGNHLKERFDSLTDQRDPRPGQAVMPSNASGSTEVNEGEQPGVVTAPHVVNIRKGQVKKFNWKKNVSKGLKTAFSSSNQSQQQQQHQQQQLHQQQQQQQQQQQVREGHAYDTMPYGMAPVSEVAPPLVARSTSDTSRHGLGLFGSKQNRPAPPRMQSSGTLTVPTVEAPKIGDYGKVNNAVALFGSDLAERAEYERRPIPSVVVRCIQEVEIRGMDVEGIYRKTGGNSQVKAIQEGFERSDEFDISDPALDITAVTSVLKQYFRKLPMPLLTYDVYDGILEANSIADEEKRALAMRDTIQQLPVRHRDCLEFLIFHLARVATRESENLMSPRNLAVVFAPTIMRDHNLDREMTDMHIKNLAIQFLIEKNKIIFANS